MLENRGAPAYQGIDLSKLKGYGFMLLGQTPLQIYNPYSINQEKNNHHQPPSQSTNKRQSLSIEKIKNYFRSPRQLLPFQPQVYPIFNEQILLVIGNTITLYSIKFKKVETQRKNAFRRKSSSLEQKQKQEKLKNFKSTGKQKKRQNRECQDHKIIETQKSIQFISNCAYNQMSQIQQPVLQKANMIETYHDIKSVYIPLMKYYQFNNEAFMLLTFQNASQVSVIKEDYRNKKIQKIYDLYFKNQKVQSAYPINDSQFIICCTQIQKNKSNFKIKHSTYKHIKLYYYLINSKICKCKQQLKLIQKLKKNQQLTAIQIGGNVTQKQDSILLIFFAIYDKQLLVSKIVAQEIIKLSYGGLQLPTKKQINYQYQNNQVIKESLTTKILKNIPFLNINSRKNALIKQPQKQEKSQSAMKRPYFSSSNISSFTSNLFNINSINSPYNNLKIGQKNNQQFFQSNNQSEISQKGQDYLSKNINQSQIVIISFIKQVVTQIKMFYRNQSFFFFLCDQIVVVKKKFGKYLILDTISDKIRNQRVCYCKTTELVSTVGKQGIQIYHLQVTDKKCNYKLIDVIQEMSNVHRVRRTLLSLWTYQKDSQIHIGFIFSGHMGKLYFQGVKSVQQIKKITQYAYQKPKQQIGKIQQLAQKLGISKKDFYITLWSISKKNESQIFLFLLPCCCLKSIHYQLASFLRRKQLPVGQIIKILQKIQRIIFQSLSKSLQVHMLKWYIKNNFLVRKFSLYPVDLKIDWAEFESIYNMGVNDIIKQSIDQHLFPQQKPICAFGVPQPKKKPKIYINHALQQFKLILLENYQNFLINLLKDYPKHIALILQNFTQLLPNYPLKIEMIPQQKTIIANSLVTLSSLLKNSIHSQQIWFSNVSFSEWKRQKMRKQKIIEQLKPYHPTSQIIAKINLLISQPWFAKKRLKRHALIQLSTLQYKEVLKNISDKHIFLTICQFANEMEYKCLLKEGQANTNLHYISTHNINNQSKIIQQKQKSNISIAQSSNQSKTNIFAQSNISKINMSDNSIIQKKQKQQRNFLKQITLIKVVTPISQKSLENEKKQLSSQKPVSKQLNPLDLLFGASKKNVQGIQKSKQSIQNQQSQMAKSTNLDPIQQKRLTKKRILASKRILLSLKKHNRLHGQSFDQCKLYLSIHHFLQIQGLIEQQLTVQALLDMSDAQLISLFFLGNKQKKYLIFNQFRSLYPSVQKFNSVIGNFANSQSSSIIELQILLMQLTGNKKSSQISEEQQLRLNQFQRNNQQLIKVIVEGVCKKIELRQITPMMHFFVLINNVQLNKDLLVLVNKINQLKRCLGIFDNFYMAEKTYYQILNNCKEIIEQIMDQYFKGKVMHHCVNIQRQSIPLNYTRNTFNLLLYLRQTVFYEISQRQLLMLYGQILIDWQQFQVLQQVIYYQSNVQILKNQQQINQFINELISKSLDKIYSKQDIIFNEQTKNHIRNILKLQKNNTTPFTIKQYSKLYLVQLFQNWGYIIRPIYLQTMCLQWQQSSQNRKQLITQFFTKYIDSINYQSFLQLYQYFQMSATGDPNIQIQSKQFFQHCKMLAQQLVKKQRSQQAALIINIIRLSGQIQAGYQLQSQCALTCLSKNKGLQGLQLSRRYIQYMVLNYQKDDVIADLFGTCFNQIEMLQKYQSIDTHQSLCYKQQGKAGQSQFMRKHGITIPLDGLWEITNTLAEYKAIDIATLKIGSIFDKNQFIHDDAALNHQKASMVDQSLQKPRKRSQSNHNFSYQAFKPNKSVIESSPQSNQNQDHVSGSVFSIFANLFNAVNNPANHQLATGNSLKSNSLGKKKKIRKTSINLQSMNFQIYNPIMNSYYFLLMGLRFPHLGFQHLYSLPYNFNMLLMLLHRLDNMVHKYKSLWRLNVQLIFEKYRKGLYALLLKQVDVDHQQIQLNEHFYDQIRQKVKNTPNSQAIKVQLTKLQQQLNSVRIKRKQRQKAHDQQIKKNAKFIQKVLGQIGLQQQVSNHQIYNDNNNTKTLMNVTCTYNQVKQMKKQINNISRDFTEKMIIETVVDHMSVLANHSQDNYLAQHNNSSISAPLGVLELLTKNIIKQTKDKRDFVEMKQSKEKRMQPKLFSQQITQSIKNCTISEFQSWILQKRYEKIELVPQKTAQQKFNQLWFSKQLSFDALIQTLKQIKIGDMRKIQPLMKIDKDLIKCHNNNLKSLFSLDYLLNYEIKSDEQQFETYIIPKLRMFICDLSLEDITSLGKIGILYEIYGLCIQMIGQDGIFDQQNVIKLEGLIKITDIQYLMANYTKLMDSMVKTKLRQVCHSCIMIKVQQQFENQVEIGQKANNNQKNYIKNLDMKDSEVLQQ